MVGSLAGIRVVDLSRILAGPSATQLLADLGADVIKVEQPGRGDDTRGWGPPFVPDPDGKDTQESAYYLCANRNKRSIAVDISTAAGQQIVRRLLRTSDVLIENFRVGKLSRFGLDYPTLAPEFPKLVYCSITGFGQTGPERDRLGYDFLVQALGGIMSITGPADAEPTKVGVGIADMMCGMYAAVGILAALRHRDATGVGQQLDLALLDTQLAWLANAGTHYLATGESPGRYGNGHPHIVPYQSFPCADGFLAVAVGNDAQFGRFSQALGASWHQDPRFETNHGRLEHRTELVEAISAVTIAVTRSKLEQLLRDADVPAGAIRSVAEALEAPQAQHRQMTPRMQHGSGTAIRVLGNPIKLSKTPIEYRRAPPTLGQDTDTVLQELGFSDTERKLLFKEQVVG